MNARPEPLSERVVDAACVGFAAWTLACHASVATGGSLWRALFAFSLLVALCVAALVWQRGRPARPEPATATGEAPAERPALRWGGLACAVLGVWLLREQPLALWWLALGLLSVAAFCFVAREAPSFEPAARGPGLEACLLALCVACGAIALVAHRVDIDDAFYVSLAVAAADAPGERLYAASPLLGLADLPLQHPAYLVHSWELWNAALSRLTGIPAIASFHLVSAALAAVLAPLAWARLFRRLTPRTWLASTAALVLVLLAAGDAHRWYGNFAFVRIWQGKSVFLTVWLPLVWCGALDFARAPSWRRGAFLAAAQVASVGATSTALWAAPVAAVTAALCAVPPRREALRTLALALLTSLYVLGLGLVVREQVDADREARLARATREVRPERIQRSQEARAKAHGPGEQLGSAVRAISGDGALASLCLVAVLGGWSFAAPGLGRRFACGVPLVVLLTLLNPYASDAVSRNVVGNSYWRTFWVLPIPVLLALGVTLPLGLLRSRTGGLVATGVAAALFAAVPERSSLAAANDVRLAAPGLKVAAEAYRRAGLLLERVAPGSVVVAPRPVAVWLSTMHGHAFPLLVRDVYLKQHRGALGREDVYLRVVMTNLASGRSEEPGAALHFRRGLDRFAVAGVLLETGRDTPSARAALRDAGFEKQLATLEYEIWTRG